MTPEERDGFIRLVRGCRDDHSAGLVLEAYAAALRGPNALDQVEQLEDWTYSGLLKCVPDARGPGPDLLDAGGLMRLRSYQLLGLLADACEIAMLDGDLKTAMQMSRLAHHAILRIKGEQTLAAAFGFEDTEVEA